MGLRVCLSMAALLIVACGGGSGTVTPVLPETPAPPPVNDNPPAGSSVVDDRPIWEGFEATRSGDRTLAALAHGQLDVYEAPGDAAPAMTLERTTILGTATVLGVVSEPADGWAEVMLPIRPNGSTGWVRADEVSFYVADSRIVVELGERRLTYTVDGVEILSTEVGIGSSHNETPTGHFFVTDNVTLANPDSAWGPHALGLSARSETITGFNGGDGIIGIHGTNNPGSVGGDISLGCVRLPNEMITALHELVPIGTRVEIRA